MNQKLLLTTILSSFIGNVASADTYTIEEGVMVAGEVSAVYTNSDLTGNYESNYRTSAQIGVYADFAHDGYSYGASVVSGIDDVNNISINEVYGYFSNGLGTFMFGKLDSSLAYYSSVPTVGLGQAGGNYAAEITGDQPFGAVGVFPNFGISEKAAAHVDLTDGLHVYGAYVPVAGNYENGIEGAIGYTLQGVSVSGSYIKASGTGMRDLSAWRVGATTEVNGVTLGIDYIDNGDAGVSSASVSKDQKSLVLGASISIGEYDFAGSYSDANGYLASGDYADTYKVTSIGLSRDLSKHWEYGADFIYRTQKVNNNESTSIGILVGTKVKF